jgi:nucleotide-binding universal stress UspA family protein
MIALKNVLVATDFGEAAGAALVYGRALARAFHATLHVLHVDNDVSLDTIGSERYIGSPPIALRSEIEEATRKRLEALVLDSAASPIPTKPAVVMSIAPAPAIVDYAVAENIGLIVMGTHGRRGVSHLLMGSVAEQVVRTAPCPVLTVHHPEHEFVVPDAPAAVARA